MKYIKENKKLLLKYLFVIITNILLYIFCSFYLKNSTYKDIIMLLIVVIVDIVIYYYKGTKKFNLYLDLLCNIIVGFILLIFERNMLSYSKILVSLFMCSLIGIIMMLMHKAQRKSILPFAPFIYFGSLMVILF